MLLWLKHSPSRFQGVCSGETGEGCFLWMGFAGNRRVIFKSRRKDGKLLLLVTTLKSRDCSSVGCLKFVQFHNFSAPLNPIPIVEHFRRSHPQCEHCYRQGVWVGHPRFPSPTLKLHSSINNDLTTSILSRVDSQPSGAAKKGTEHLQRGFQWNNSPSKCWISRI